MNINFYSLLIFLFLPCVSYASIKAQLPRPSDQSKVKKNREKGSPNNRKNVFSTPKKRRYIVESIKGDMLILAPWSTSWQLVKKGMILEENVLFQNLSPIITQLRDLDVTNKRDDETLIHLNFPKPTMMRLIKPVGRPLIIRSEMMSTSKLNFPFGSQARSESNYNKPLSSAWFRANRLTAELGDNTKKFKDIVQPRQEMGVPSIEKPHGKIVITHPKDGSIFVVDKFPQNVPLIWEEIGPVNPKTKKEIYLWQNDKEFGSPLTTVQESPFMLEIAQPGHYYIGIVTEDHLIASDQIIVTFE